MSSPKNSPPKKGSNGSIQPSLVILTKDDYNLTNFHKRRFNPEEFTNLFDVYKTNPFGPDAMRDTQNRGTFGGFGFGDDDSPNSRKNKNKNKNQGQNGSNSNNGNSNNGNSNNDNYNNGNYKNGDIIDLASLGSDFDINQLLGDGNTDISTSDFDLQSTTTASSYYPGDEELYKKLQRQLNLSVFGNLFPSEFDDMEQNQKRELGRVARLQTAQKRNWYNGLCRLFGFFDNKKSKDRLWNNLKKFMKTNSNSDENDQANNKGDHDESKNAKRVRFRDGIEIDDDSDSKYGSRYKTQKKPWNEYDSITDDTVAKSMMYSAKKVFESFLISDRCGLNLFMRAVIVGPHCSGKTYYLRAILIHALNYLIDGGQFKSLFIVPIDFAKAKIKTAADFYNFISETVIESLLIQRADLQLFKSSLRKAFSVLPTISHMKKLPKPISSQDYLRQSMKEVDVLLERMHRCYNDPDLIESFISNVAVLPQTIGNIFNFDTTFLVIDHIDLIDINLKPKDSKVQNIRLFEYMKFGLTQTQFLVSCVDSQKMYNLMQPLNSRSVDLRFISQVVTVYDTCDSDHIYDLVRVNFVENPIRKTLPITIEHCGGCPLFVCSFDDICNTFLKMKNDYLPIAVMEKNVELVTQSNELIKTLFNYKTIPEISEVTMEDLYEEKQEEEEKNETKK